MMEHDAHEEPELVITRSSSKDGGIGWNIRLKRLMLVEEGAIEGDAPDQWVRPETDKEYRDRCLDMHHRLEAELLGKKEANAD